MKLNRTTIDFEEYEKQKKLRKEADSKETLNAMIFNKALRVNSEALFDAIERGPTLGFYILDEELIHPLDERALFRLKKKLDEIKVPLFLVKSLPKGITHVYTYTNLSFDVFTFRYEDYYVLKNEKEKPYKIFTQFVEELKPKVYSKEYIVTKQELSKANSKRANAFIKTFDSLPIKEIGKDPYVELHSLLMRLKNKLDNGSCKETFLSKYINRGMIDYKYFVYKMKFKNDDVFKRLIHRDYFLNLDYNEILEINMPFDPSSEELFDAWKSGRTGYPIVDSSMRCLNDTGHLKNEYRILVASFWVKVCKGDWKKGLGYFKKVLHDYDEKLCTCGWMYACGPLNPMKFIKYNYDKNDDIIEEYPTDYCPKII